MNKGWIIFIAVVVILFGGLIAYNQLTKPKIDLTGLDFNTILPASDQNGQIADHVLGSTANKVTIIEYGDFQCPYCGQAAPQLQSIMEKYSENVTFIFRNFPLTTQHPNARAAAAIAEAAGLQGKYWDMYHQLYNTQKEWSNLTGTERTSVFAGYAEKIGLNMDTYNTDLTKNTATINQKILFDQAIGNKIGITSTPSIFVNGTLISSEINQDVETAGGGSKLEALLNEKLKAAGLPVPSAE